jgi:hypothetical protein
MDFLTYVDENGEPILLTKNTKIIFDAEELSVTVYDKTDKENSKIIYNFHFLDELILFVEEISYILSIKFLDVSMDYKNRTTEEYIIEEFKEYFFKDAE